MLGIALTAAVAAAIGAVLAPFGWPFELFVHFRWQLAAACSALLAAAFALRRPWMMAVALAARRVDRLERLHAEIETAGGQALVVPTDVRETAATVPPSCWIWDLSSSNACFASSPSRPSDRIRIGVSK